VSPGKSTGPVRVSTTATACQFGRPRRWPGKLHGDKGYDYRSCREVVRRHGMIARIARTGIESATHLGRHRYVIERCLE